jgi:hypothetical protein
LGEKTCSCLGRTGKRGKVKRQVGVDLQEGVAIVQVLGDGNVELCIGFLVDDKKALATGCVVVEKAMEIVFGEKKGKEVMKRLNEKLHLKLLEN